MTSILDPWHFDAQRDLYERLALLDTADAWRIITDIRFAELEQLEHDDVDLWASHVEPRVELAQFLGDIDTKAFSRDVASWMLTRTIHYSFLITRFLRAGGDMAKVDIDLDWG